MYQIADIQLNETIDLLNTYSVFPAWNGPVFRWHDRSEFSTVVLVLVFKDKILVLVLQNGLVCMTATSIHLPLLLRL